jgi:hypothetical protein
MKSCHDDRKEFKVTEGGANSAPLFFIFVDPALKSGRTHLETYDSGDKSIFFLTISI